MLLRVSKWNNMTNQRSKTNKFRASISWLVMNVSNNQANHTYFLYLCYDLVLDLRTSINSFMVSKAMKYLAMRLPAMVGDMAVSDWSMVIIPALASLFRSFWQTLPETKLRILEAYGGEIRLTYTSSVCPPDPGCVKTWVHNVLDFSWHGRTKMSKWAIAWLLLCRLWCEERFRRSSARWDVCVD